MNYDSETVRRFAERLRDESLHHDDRLGWSGGLVLLVLSVLLLSIVMRFTFAERGQTFLNGEVVMASIAPAP